MNRTPAGTLPRPAEPEERFGQYARQPHCVWLDTHDEVFATNSLIEIAPVVTWSHKHHVTTRLQHTYGEVVRKELGL